MGNQSCCEGFAHDEKIIIEFPGRSEQLNKSALVDHSELTRPPLLQKVQANLEKYSKF